MREGERGASGGDPALVFLRDLVEAMHVVEATFGTRDIWTLLGASSAVSVELRSLVGNYGRVTGTVRSEIAKALAGEPRTATDEETR